MIFLGPSLHENLKMQQSFCNLCQQLRIVAVFVFAGVVGATPTCTLTQGSNQTFEGSTHTYTADGWVGLLHLLSAVSSLLGLVSRTTHSDSESFESRPTCSRPLSHFSVTAAFPHDLRSLQRPYI